MIVLDTNSLVRMMVSEESSDDASRLRGLLEMSKREAIPIGIPAPVFGEFLVRTDDATTDILNALDRRQSIRILPFDKRAAHECALLDRYALAQGDKKQGARAVPWQKLKIDRQILAIARVHGAQLIVTSDASLRTLANRVGITVTSVPELPIREQDKQHALDLKAPAEKDQPGRS